MVCAVASYQPHPHFDVVIFSGSVSVSASVTPSPSVDRCQFSPRCVWSWDYANTSVAAFASIESHTYRLLSRERRSRLLEHEGACRVHAE